ncbi:acyl-CoA dehydrogenase/oxidase [Pilobolus umbonatus]|nr:acyl-CoA dehydrogenase/oxidase [Pilobolus umbonatus]
MSLAAPVDMARERAAASFDITKLCHLWAKGEDKYNRLQAAYEYIKNDPDLVVQPPRNILEFDRDEMREFTMGQIHRMATLHLAGDGSRDQFYEISNAVMIYSESFGLRIGVHDSLFRNVIQMLGNKEQQEEWVPLIDEFQVIGCFSMTELGHSSALRDIETTATFDVERDEFILDSPTVTSTKWWIGMAGHAATHTVVIAQTIVNGENVGLNWFIVQLRDRNTGELMPDIQAGDIGSKVGHQGVDNGWIQFRQTRVPRTRMLSKWVSIDREGNYEPAPNPAVMYATLIPERISLVLIALILTSQALTIATRYGVVRRQGNKNQQIMDYQSHYVKLLPAISFMYMVQNAFDTTGSQFEVLTAGGEMDPIVYLNHMGDMHCMSASLKGLAGTYCTEILEICRRCCGGHAYSSYNGLGSLIGDWGVITTGGGDNVVLLQQATSYLLYRMKQVVKYDSFPELKYNHSSSNYLKDAKELLKAQTWSLTDVDNCDLSIIQNALYTITLQSLQDALDAGSKHDDLLLESVKVAELHCAAFLFSDNARKFSNKAESNLDPSVFAVMNKMTRLWGLHALRTFGDQGFMEGFLTAAHMKNIEKVYLKICKEMRYEVVGLTDGFGLPDFILKAPIAKYDGDIYQPYFDTLLQAPASTGVPPYHAKYIKPLTGRNT